MSAVDRVADGIRRLALRTPTLPPATHTNAYLIGEGELSIVDPASPWDDEQRRLEQALIALEERGERLARIVLTHHHDDHVGGARRLAEWSAGRGRPVPVAADARTAPLVARSVEVTEVLHPDQVYDWGGRRITPVFTPGHAPGHLVFHDLDSRATVAGDMVAGVGTIVLSPVDGDLGLYLASLERMRTLNSSVLLPAHGPALPHAEVVLSFYVAHRHQRSDQIRRALDTAGSSEPLGLVPLVYPELPPEVHPLAAVQVLTHLHWLRDQGLAWEERGRWSGHPAAR